MSCDDLKRGGAAVGHLADLSALEIAAVLHMRVWDQDAPFAAQKTQAMPRDAHDQAWDAFARLRAVLSTHWRRPLVRHCIGCRCLGADEAAFAHFVSASGGGDREDAMLLASLLVRPAMTLAAVNVAEPFGLALRRVVANGRFEHGDKAALSVQIH